MLNCARRGYAARFARLLFLVVNYLMHKVYTFTADKYVGVGDEVGHFVLGVAERIRDGISGPLAHFFAVLSVCSPAK
jgi:hypothetical protein